MNVMRKIRRFIFGDEVHRRAKDLQEASEQLRDSAREFKEAMNPILDADDPFAALTHQRQNARTARMLRE